MHTNDAKEYLSKRQIPHLFESMLTGLMYHRPEDPLAFLENCLHTTRELGGPECVAWDTFIIPDHKPLPPITSAQGKKLPCKLDSGPCPGPYRRYDRLPPIQAQLSIDSDSDMTECSGLIQEYEVFDPLKPRPHIIFIIGGPGSGKGTQMAKIAAHYDFECVSVGEILRNQLLQHAPSDRKWELIAQIIANGELAPQETTIEELKHQFIKKQDAKGFIVDGFPRDISQAFTFEEQIGSPDLVILLACSNQQLRQRLENRALQQGRPDDNTHAIEKRLETFKHNITLIVKYYQERGVIIRVDADRDEDEIFEDIKAIVKERLFQKEEGCRRLCMCTLSGKVMVPESVVGRRQAGKRSMMLWKMLSTNISAWLMEILSWIHHLKLNPSKTKLLYIPGDLSPHQDLVISQANTSVILRECKTPQTLV